jgi:hypothetical protein
MQAKGDPAGLNWLRPTTQPNCPVPTSDPDVGCGDLIPDPDHETGY